MSKLVFSIIEIKENMPVYGLKQKSNDRTQSNDISQLSKKYYEIINKRSGDVIPFFVVSSPKDRTYDADQRR